MDDIKCCIFDNNPVLNGKSTCRDCTNMLTEISKKFEPKNNGCWMPGTKNCDCPACGGPND